MFALIDATVVVGDPSMVEEEEVVPGVSRPLRAVMRAGGTDIGVLIGRLPATRRWEPADQDLLELFANAMAAAIRNAQLFATVETQNRQLLELDAAKDDFLRGVSHNLQTPLTSIRAYAEQLLEAQPDRRLGIIAEQAERLSRMVRQLLTVTRLESGALKPRTEVVSLSTRARKAWEALGVDDVPFALEDGAAGWLAVADADQLDQVLWALLDNAVKYGAGSPVRATIAVDEADRRRAVDHRGPGSRDRRRRPRAAVRAVRPRDRGGLGWGQRPRALRVARAVPGDGRGAGAGARGRGRRGGVHDRAAGRARRRGLSAAGRRPAPGRPARRAGRTNAGPWGPGVSVLDRLCQAGLGRPSGADDATEGDVGRMAWRFQIIPRGSPTIRPAAAAPMIGPRTGLMLRISASMAPAYQPV